jgi:hypothetical protein
MYESTEEIAQQRAACLRKAYPENRYEVEPYPYAGHSPGPNGVTWGVVKYVVFFPDTPWEADGFVWFA